MTKRIEDSELAKISGAGDVLHPVEKDLARVSNPDAIKAGPGTGGGSGSPEIEDEGGAGSGSGGNVNIGPA